MQATEMRKQSHLRRSRQIEYQQQSVLHRAQLVMRQVSGSLTERARIDGANQLAKDQRRFLVNRDL